MPLLYDRFDDGREVLLKITGWFVKNKERFQVNSSRFFLWVWVCAFVKTRVSDAVQVVQFHILRNVLDPRYHLLSWAPAISTVQPGTVLIWFHSLTNAVLAAVRSCRVLENPDYFVLVVDYKLVRGYTELCATIIIASMTSDNSDKFNEFR